MSHEALNRSMARERVLGAIALVHGRRMNSRHSAVAKDCARAVPAAAGATRYLDNYLSW